MRRALAFCTYQAKWWEARAKAAENDTSTDRSLCEGKVAFAREHVAQELKMRAVWTARWRPALVAAQATNLLWIVTLPAETSASEDAQLPFLDLCRDADGRDAVGDEI
jgi:hypothetical protein